MKCPHCQQLLPTGYSEPSCPICGTDLRGISLAELNRPRVNGPMLIAVLLAPVVLTMIVATLGWENLTVTCILLASLTAGIVSGVMLSRIYTGHGIGGRIVMALFLSVVLTIVCLATCFVGCSLVGSGGVRIGS